MNWSKKVFIVRNFWFSENLAEKAFLAQIGYPLFYLAPHVYSAVIGSTDEMRSIGSHASPNHEFGISMSFYFQQDFSCLNICEPNSWIICCYHGKLWKVVLEELDAGDFSAFGKAAFTISTSNGLNVIQSILLFWTFIYYTKAVNKTNYESLAILAEL